ATTTYKSDTSGSASIRWVFERWGTNERASSNELPHFEFEVEAMG
ncbi:16484_t:CDS:1, partial [Gigaspora rosea]